MAYDIIDIPASPATYTAGRGGNSVSWITVHYTGAPGSARNNGVYFSGGNRDASAHYFIDDDDIVSSVPEEDTAWHAGNFNANQCSIGIEVCSDGEDFSDEEIARLTWLVGDIMSRYGIDADHVVRHHDMADYGFYGSWVDPHKDCPAPYVSGDPDGSKWAWLHATITEGDFMTDQDKQDIINGVLAGVGGSVASYYWPPRVGSSIGGTTYNSTTHTPTIENLLWDVNERLAWLCAHVGELCAGYAYEGRKPEDSKRICGEANPSQENLAWAACEKLTELQDEIKKLKK